MWCIVSIFYKTERAKNLEISQLGKLCVCALREFPRALKIVVDYLDRLTCLREIPDFLHVKIYAMAKNFHHTSTLSAKYNYPISHYQMHLWHNPQQSSRESHKKCLGYLSLTT